MISYIILLAACLQWLSAIQGESGGVTWSEYDRKLKVLCGKHPVLVVPYKFNYTLEFFKNYPSQQIISPPTDHRPRLFKTCPFERILLLTSLNRWQYWGKATRYFFRFCPLGTAYYVINDAQIFLDFEERLWPYFAPVEPVKKGLYYGVQLIPTIGKLRKTTSYPQTWTDERLLDKASIVDISYKSAGSVGRYDLLFRAGNYTLENVQMLLHTSAKQSRSNYCLACPIIGSLKPAVYSVYKPQALHVSQITDENFADDPCKVAAFGIGLTVALMTWLSSPGKSLTHAVYVTAVSPIAGIPLSFPKPGVKLVLSLGFWFFFGQIFVPIMKGELVTLVSAGYRDKIHRIEVCSSELIEADIKEDDGVFFALPVYAAGASGHLLAYKAACFLDILEARPFMTGFQVKYPKAETYLIKISPSVIRQTAEINSNLVDSDLRRTIRPMFRRAGTCNMKGNFYLQRILQAGLFEGSMYVPYWRKSQASQGITLDGFLSWWDKAPTKAYSRHERRLSELEESRELNGSNIDLCKQVVVVGWFVASAVFVVSFVIGKRKTAFDCQSRWLCPEFLRKTAWRYGTRVGVYTGEPYDRNRPQIGRAW